MAVQVTHLQFILSTVRINVPGPEAGVAIGVASIFPANWGRFQHNLAEMGEKRKYFHVHVVLFRFYIYPELKNFFGARKIRPLKAPMVFRHRFF